MFANFLNPVHKETQSLEGGAQGSKLKTEAYYAKTFLRSAGSEPKP